MDTPSVTVIIPVRNECRFIATVLRNCFEQDYPHDKMEIIIPEGRSTDGTRDEIERFIKEYPGGGPAVRVIDNPFLDLPHGFNRAINQASGEIILLLGAHAVYAANYISECVSVLLQSGANNVGGPTQAIASTFIGKCIALAYNSSFAVGGARCHQLDYTGDIDTVSFGCWRRSYLLSMGGYDEELIRNHDDDLNFRTILSGGRVYQSSTIKSCYYSRTSFTQLLQQQFQYGYEKIRVIQKHNRPASPRHLIPMFFVAGLIFAPFAMLLSAYSIYFIAAVMTLYAGLSIGCATQVAFANGLRYLPVLPVVYFIYHIGYGTGSIIGVFDFYFFHAWFRRHSSYLTNLTR